jgi:hypothetical protein
MLSWPADAPLDSLFDFCIRGAALGHLFEGVCREADGFHYFFRSRAARSELWMPFTLRTDARCPAIAILVFLVVVLSIVGHFTTSNAVAATGTLSCCQQADRIPATETILVWDKVTIHIRVRTL